MGRGLQGRVEPGHISFQSGQRDKQRDAVNATVTEKPNEDHCFVGRHRVQKGHRSCSAAASSVLDTHRTPYFNPN